MIGVGLSLLTLITLIIIGADFRSPNVCRVNTYSFERDKPFFFFLFGLLALCYLFLALAVLSVICRNQFFRSWTGQKVRSTRTWLYCGIGAWADRPNSL